MRVPLALQRNEHVVPVASDGEFFLPLGRVESRSADETVIALDRLPPPLVDSRSLTGLHGLVALNGPLMVMAWTCGAPSAS